MQFKKASLLLAIGAVLGVAEAASADVVQFNYTTPYTNNVVPEGPSPYLTAKFEDVGTNNVKMTLSAVGLVEEEFVTAWLFNLDPALDLSKIAFSLNAAATTAPTAALTKDSNDLSLGGQAVGFDFGTYFGTTNKDQYRFEAGEVFVGNLSTTQAGKTLTANSFKFQNAEGNVFFYSVAKVQGIDPYNNQSTKIGAVLAPGNPTPIPLPAAAWGGIALLGALGLGKLRRRSQNV